MDDDEYERLSDVDVDIDKDEDEDRRSSSSSFEEYTNILARDNDDTVDAMPPSLAAAKRGGGLRCDESGSKNGGSGAYCTRRHPTKQVPRRHKNILSAAQINLSARR